MGLLVAHIRGTEKGRSDKATWNGRIERAAVEVSRTILKSDVDGAFLDSEYTKQPRDFVRMFWWIFENHEQILK